MIHINKYGSFDMGQTTFLMTEKVLSLVAIDSAFVINLLNDNPRNTKENIELFYLLFISAVSDIVRGC